MTDLSHDVVQRRRVHYLSGFDPRGAAHYHRLYSDEAQLQAQLGDVQIEVGRRRKKGPRLFSWAVTGHSAQGCTQTDYQFMAWDDLIRKAWEGNLLRLCWSGLAVYWGYWRCGGIRKTHQTARNAYYGCVFPLFYLVVLFCMSLALGGVFALGAMHHLPWQGGEWAGLLLGCVLFLLGLKLGDRLGVFWVMRTTIFIYSLGVRPQPEWQARAAEMATHIIQAQQRDPVDEVLIVGHSVGSILAVAVVSHIVQQLKEDRAILPAMSLLTLGECMCYLGFIPSADGFRADLARVAGKEGLPWFDVTAPPDPLCFHLTDPVLAAGLEMSLPHRPALFNARIFKMFRPETYKKIRRNKLQLHFQYLKASELPSDYDYFHITAGPERIAHSLSKKRAMS